MNINEIWIWLMIGLCPYRFKRTHLAGGVCLWEARALFWSLSVYQRRTGRNDWVMNAPLIERLRDAVWAAVIRLQSDEPQDQQNSQQDK
jgi:hypothetical protein